MYGLVGSGMCKRDRVLAMNEIYRETPGDAETPADEPAMRALAQQHLCLLYTSEAADERSSVDLGGRRIIKKKRNKKKKKLETGRDRER